MTAATSYGAWSCMTKTLEAKSLVERNTKGGKCHTFRLSAEGRELAARIVEVWWWCWWSGGVDVDVGMVALVVLVLASM